MGKKSERREARTAAAKKRDADKMAPHPSRHWTGDGFRYAPRRGALRVVLAVMSAVGV